MLAEDQRSLEIDVTHYLGGMYIAAVERLSKYWIDQNEMHDLAVMECSVDSPRLLYWARLSRFLRFPWARIVRKRFTKESTQLANLLEAALVYASSRKERGPMSAPVLTPEDLLLALATAKEIPLGLTLARGTLDLGRLEQEVRTEFGGNKRALAR